MPESILRLASGLSVSSPETILAKKFDEWPWEKYDGVTIADANVITESDVDRVYQLGARSSRKAYHELIKSRGKEISKCLRMIPENRSLEDADDKVHSLRTAVVDLVNIITDQKGVKLAGAMKLLSPFRPGFLPVIDSIVENYYWFALSMSNEAQFRQLEAAYHSTWGDYVWFLLDLMRNDIIVARAEIDRVRAAFSEKPLASISRVRVLESLIWYYYARGRYQGD